MSIEPAAENIAPAGQAEAALFTIGDITVSPSWVVTPNGNTPLAGSTWNLTDLSTTRKTIPPWAIVLAIVLFPIGLLFLLAKKEKRTVVFEVTVQNAGFFHASRVVPGKEPAALAVRENVNRARALAASSAT